MRSERAAGDSSMGIEIIPNVRKPFHVAATGTSHEWPDYLRYAAKLQSGDCGGAMKK
jgi:hypothetical protein